MKIARNCLRVLTVLLAAASLLMFFFTFAEIRFSGSDVVLGASGAEMSFGADVTSRVPALEAGAVANLYKSGWFMIGLIWAALTTLIAALGFKFKKCFNAAPVLSLLGGILMLVLVLGKGATYVDVGNLDTLLTIESISMSLFAVLSCVCSFGATLSGVGQILVNDRIEVLESKGSKISIPKRIARFFRDYKGEIKKIVWPTGKSVLRNTIVVLVMCVIVGAFIWLLDWGLSSLLKLILNSAA